MATTFSAYIALRQFYKNGNQRSDLSDVFIGAFLVHVREGSVCFLAQNFLPGCFNEGADCGCIGPVGRKLVISGDFAADSTEDVKR
jgi:hypothetical protein